MASPNPKKIVTFQDGLHTTLRRRTARSQSATRNSFKPGSTSNKRTARSLSPSTTRTVKKSKVDLTVQPQGVSASDHPKTSARPRRSTIEGASQSQRATLKPLAPLLRDIASEPMYSPDILTPDAVEDATRGASVEEDQAGEKLVGRSAGKQSLNASGAPRELENLKKATDWSTRMQKTPRTEDYEGEITEEQLKSLDDTLDELRKPYGIRFNLDEKLDDNSDVSQSQEPDGQENFIQSQATRPDPKRPGCTLGEKFTPQRLSYPQHPHGEHSDEWWTQSIYLLYKRVMSCAETHFGQADIGISGAERGNWLKAGVNPELETYVSMVAEEDPANGGWERLLAEKSHRSYLVAAIITKVLEAKVFSQLLFGAERDQIEFLQNLEKNFIDHEAYERTALRASTVRTMLDSHPITPLFSHSVLSLAHQLFALLLPFDCAQRDLALLAQTSGRHSFAAGVHVYEPGACLQDLHDIVGIAAYLSICMRLSETIMFIRPVMPGGRYEEEDQFNVDHGLYLSSKVGVERYKLENERNGRHEKYTPRIKIAVWPSFKRFSPGNGEPGGERNGFRVYDVSKSGVVYYWAVDNRANRDGVKFSLFLKKEKLGQGVRGWLRRKLAWHRT